MLNKYAGAGTLKLEKVVREGDHIRIIFNKPKKEHYYDVYLKEEEALELITVIMEERRRG